MREFTEQMKADHAEALRINADMTANPETEVSALRLALTQIRKISNLWARQYSDGILASQSNPRYFCDRLEVISTTANAALKRTKPATPLTRVNVGGEIFAGNIIEPFGDEKFPDDWVTIEVIDIDPTAGRMAITGPLAGYRPRKETVN